MARHSDQILDSYGRPVPGAMVYVYDMTNPAAPVLETLTNDAALALANPLTTDEFGSFYFNAADGEKLLDIWFGGARRWKSEIVMGPSGGNVVQAASKATGVALNTSSGEITMDAAALAGGAAVSFTLTNIEIGADDIVALVIKSGATAGAYAVGADAVAAGSCRISLRNLTGGALAEAVVLQFAVLPGRRT